MSVRTYSATMLGLTPIPIEVEVDTNRGQPKLVIIGLPSRTVTEAKERITAAFLNCNLRIKAKRTVVNLAPADLKKSDSCFELAIAAALLKEYGILRKNTDKYIFFGELALSGEIKPMKGALPLVMAAAKMGFEKVIIPAANEREVVHLKNPAIYPLKHFQQLVDFARGKQLKKIAAKKWKRSMHQAAEQLRLSDIVGQSFAKRALAISAAGGHNLLMVGPPGVGKSMLAQAAASLKPPLSKAEATEVSVIHSISKPLLDGLIGERPFRQPHHSISATGLIGGGHDLHPGEISLAHHGVLFIDEINEFDRRSLEALRKPLEKGSVTLTRSQGTAKYPANFTLIAAANPCPCGYFGSTIKKCNCSHYQVEQYQRRLSGPLRDRIDLQVYLEPVASVELAKNSSQPAVIDNAAELIAKARKSQYKRFKSAKISQNASLNSKLIKQYCTVEPSAHKLLATASGKLGLSTRGYYAILKIAQTIADLEGENDISSRHVAEALQYRS